MGNRIRSFIESIVYAGMKPSGRPSGDAPAAKPGLLDRLFSSPDTSDPLYLTNQTFGQKARRYLRLAIPLVVVIAVALAAIGLFAPKHPIQAKQPTQAEIAAKSLTAFDKQFKLDYNKDVEI